MGWAPVLSWGLVTFQDTRESSFFKSLLRTCLAYIYQPPVTSELVSDGYRVYQYWQGLRQSCLAHLIRAAKGLAERVEASVARFGARVHAELQRLCHMGTERPTVGQWRAWYARFSQLLKQHATREDNAGTFARRLQREGDSLWVFLDVQGVEATNNMAEVRSVDQKPSLQLGGLVLGDKGGNS